MWFYRSNPNKSVLCRLHCTFCFIRLDILPIMNDCVSQFIEVFFPPTVLLGAKESLSYGFVKMMLKEVLETRIEFLVDILFGISRHTIPFLRPGCL